MRSVITIILTGLALFSAEATVFAADRDEKADKAVYQKLIREIRGLYADQREVCTRVLAEARENDGEASPALKVQVLKLRNAIEQKTARLMLVASRHGWDVPDFHGQVKKQAQPMLDQDDIFSPVDRMINKAFRKEAVLIAFMVQLPVISREVKTEKRED